MKSRKTEIFLYTLILTGLVTLFFYSCNKDEEITPTSKITVNLTNATNANGHFLWATVYAENETEVNNPDKVMATMFAEIQSGAASATLQEDDGNWQPNGIEWIGTEGETYDIYVYTDSDNDNDPTTGPTVGKIIDPAPQSITINGDQTFAVNYTDMVVYPLGDGMITVDLHNATDANNHFLWATLYAENETDVNNPDKVLATMFVQIQADTISITLQEDDGIWQPNGSEWIGAEGETYDIYVYIDTDDDNDPSTGPTVDKIIDPAPQTITINGDQTFTVNYTEMVDYVLGDGAITVELTDATAANGLYLGALLYAENETDILNPDNVIAAMFTQIESGTASFALQEDDGNWEPNGTEWVGTEGVRYDLYIHTANEASASPRGPDRQNNPYPATVLINGNQNVSVNYSDMDNFTFREGTVTVELTNASAANGHYLWGTIYEEDETEVNNPAKVLATMFVQISSSTASIILQESDGNWNPNGTEWKGSIGTTYDIYVYTDSDDDNNPGTGPGVAKIIDPAPQTVTIDGDQTFTVNYMDMVDYQLDPNLVLWNKLGSEMEVQNSVIGENGTIVGTVNFNHDVKFEKGITPNIGNAGSGIDFPTTVVDPEKGTVEMWAKFYEVPVAYSHGVYGFINVGHWSHNVMGFYWHNSSSTLQMDLSFNGTIRSVSINGFAPAIDTPVHLACIWDRNGIDGSGDYFRIYVDGAIVATNTTDNDWGIDNISGDFRVAAPWDNNFAIDRYSLDNIKIWNYAKTDFSDRHKE